MTHRRTWQKWEQEVCHDFGGERRGPDYVGVTGGNNDCVGVPGWSIEVKYTKSPTWGKLQNAVEQARASSLPSDIPVAVVKKAQTGREEALVVMRYQDFLDWFVGGQTEP